MPPSWPQYNMPWGPDPFRSNIFLLARYLGAQGWSENQIHAHLTQNAGLYTSRSGAPVRPQEITRAARFGAEWGARIRPMMRGHLDEVIERDWMMRNANLGSAYRWSVLFQMTNTATGQTEYNTVVITSNTNLTIREIRDLALTTYAELAVRNPSFQRFTPTYRQRFTVTTAERRTG